MRKLRIVNIKIIDQNKKEKGETKEQRLCPSCNFSSTQLLRANAYLRFLGTSEVLELSLFCSKKSINNAQLGAEELLQAWPGRILSDYWSLHRCDPRGMSTLAFLLSLETIWLCLFPEKKKIINLRVVSLMYLFCFLEAWAGWVELLSR